VVTPTAERLAELKPRLVHPFATFMDFDGTKSERQLLVESELKIGDLFPEKNAVVQPVRDALAEYKGKRTYKYGPVIEAAIAIAPELFRGLRVSDGTTVARSVIAHFGDMTYIFPRRLIETLREMPIEKRGLIIGVTGAPQVVAEEFGRKHGFDLVYSAVYKSADGVYTGEVDKRSIHDKGGILDELEGLMGLDMDQCIALGDSETDIPMFERVGYPFAVNPHSKLLDWIRRNAKMIYVNDRQKNGVMLFHAAARRPSDHASGRGGMFHEISLADTLPDYVPVFDLPGSVP